MITNITQYLERQLEIRGNKVAVADAAQSMTFEQLYIQAIGVARQIQDAKPGYNRPVILFGR